MTHLATWFKERPLWQQDAARRLLQRPELLASDIDELVQLCKDETTGVARPDSRTRGEPIPEHLLERDGQQTRVQLDAIEGVKGINALAPRRPLEFGSESLVIIYGPNGSGKSGYMRLMKHVCGAPTSGRLYGNVFATTQQEQSCTIQYTFGSEKRRAQWTPKTGAVTDLQSVAIYDTGCAHVYVNDAHEVTYEPPILGLLRRLVVTCGVVDQVLGRDIASTPSLLPRMPAEYADTEAQRWLGQLGGSTSCRDIETHSVWSSQDEESLTVLGHRLAEPDPAARARALRNTKTQVSKLVTLIESIETQVSDEAFIANLQARQDASIKRRAASDDAQRVFSSAPLQGVASDSWRLLWEKARAFSDDVAYPASSFPNTADGARCVLCQQVLIGDSRGRLRGFEAFVRGALEREAAEAEKKCQDLADMRVEIPDDADLDARLDLAGLADETARSLIKARVSAMRSRRERFLSGDDVDTLPTLPVENAREYLVKSEAQLESRATTFEDDAASNDLGQVRKQKREFEARKWLHTQTAAIVAEVERQKRIGLLEKARRLTNTKALSDQASRLSQELVTDAFKERFQLELRALGATTLQASLERVGASKGQVLHRLKLTRMRQPVPTSDVLSEGEFRIVSIAAFLADVAADCGSTAFIFDDPISSLDQTFEEKVAERLVALAASRQVIVLTHRLSLLSSLDEAGRKANVSRHLIALDRQDWGTGEPCDAPLAALKPIAALNTLLKEKLPRARKLYEELGSSEYSDVAKGLCCNIRIAIERLIENDLLADVIQRFRRQIHTMNKLDKIAKVTAEDCRFLDSMMTKYSYYEHSQPLETPVAIPCPDELHDDLTELIRWQTNFSKREVLKP